MTARRFLVPPFLPKASISVYPERRRRALYQFNIFLTSEEGNVVLNLGSNRDIEVFFDFFDTRY